MKKKLMVTKDFGKKFQTEKIDGKKMNFLMGGDFDGNQPPPPDPWG